MTTTTENAIASRYDEVSPTYVSPPSDEVTHRLFWLAYDHLTWTAVERLLPKNGERLRVLDAGGGGGKFSVKFAERGHDVTVLDISLGMLAKAEERFREHDLLARAARFVRGDVAELPFEDESFDFVFSEGDPVSYCLDRYPRAIGELVRVASRGAPIVLGVDNRFEHFAGTLKYGRPSDALAVLLTGRATCPYGLPVHTFTLPELTKAVDAAGADLLEIFGKPVFFFELIDAIRGERGEGVDLWAMRDEILALAERLAHEGYAPLGQHLQVMARRRA